MKFSLFFIFLPFLSSHSIFEDENEKNAVYINPDLNLFPDAVPIENENGYVNNDPYSVIPSDPSKIEEYATRIDVSRKVASGMAKELESIPYSNAYKVKKTLYKGSSRFQEISVVESEHFGNIMVIDRDLMLTERDEFHYHEMMANVPLAYLRNATRALVIGGGDGGTLREVLRHPNIANATMVDIDKKVIETAKRFFNMTSASFFHPRGTVVFADGAKWARDRCNDTDFQKVDVIIIDSTDFSAAVPLFQSSFYSSLKECVLRKGGILVHNLDSLCWDIETVRLRTARLREIFKHVHIYQVFQPTYSGGHYSINFASDEIHPFESEIDWEFFKNKNLHLKYYNPDMHYASFSLPSFVRMQDIGVPQNNLEQVSKHFPKKEIFPFWEAYGNEDVFDPIRKERLVNKNLKSNTL